MVAGRPYSELATLLRRSDELTRSLPDADLAEALAGHPRIGERAGSALSAWSRQEQAGATAVDDATRGELADANAAYEQRFGHVYLVCATGKDADELLAICRARLGNDAEQEQRVVREELAKINRIRLEKLLGVRS